MLKRKLSLVLVLTILFTTFSFSLNASAAVTQEAPAGWRNLLDYRIFTDTSPEGWAGDGGFGLDVVNDSLPVDTTVQYNNLPSLKLQTTQNPDSSSWFLALVTVAGWKAYDFRPYYDNGSLEFNIKGQQGGETFQIGFKDRVFERSAGEEITTTVNINSYTRVATDWVHVKIPLKDIMDTSQGLDISSIDCLSIKNDGANGLTVWLNDIRITSPDKETVYAPIKVNQLGYAADAPKQALVSGFEDVLTVSEDTPFTVKNAADDSTAFTGTLVLKKNYDAIDSGERVFTADFTNLATPGQYYISVTGLQNSPTFMIGETNDVYGPLAVDSARYFYYQRTGIDISARIHRTIRELILRLIRMFP